MQVVELRVSEARRESHFALPRVEGWQASEAQNAYRPGGEEGCCRCFDPVQACVLRYGCGSPSLLVHFRGCRARQMGRRDWPTQTGAIRSNAVEPRGKPLEPGDRHPRRATQESSSGHASAKLKFGRPQSTKGAAFAASRHEGEVAEYASCRSGSGCGCVGGRMHGRARACVRVSVCGWAEAAGLDSPARSERHSGAAPATVVKPNHGHAVQPLPLHPPKIKGRVESSRDESKRRGRRIPWQVFADNKEHAQMPKRSFRVQGRSITRRASCRSHTVARPRKSAPKQETKTARIRYGSCTQKHPEIESLNCRDADLAVLSPPHTHLAQHLSVGGKQTCIRAHCIACAFALGPLLDRIRELGLWQSDCAQPVAVRGRFHLRVFGPYFWPTYNSDRASSCAAASSLACPFCHQKFVLQSTIDFILSLSTSESRPGPRIPEKRWIRTPLIVFTMDAMPIVVGECENWIWSAWCWGCSRGRRMWTRAAVRFDVSLWKGPARKQEARAESRTHARTETPSVASIANSQSHPEKPSRPSFFFFPGFGAWCGVQVSDAHRHGSQTPRLSMPSAHSPHGISIWQNMIPLHSKRRRHCQQVFAILNLDGGVIFFILFYIFLWILRSDRWRPPASAQNQIENKLVRSVARSWAPLSVCVSLDQGQ
ncbi:hypothetical protein L1887_43981 [Cichorium endivia]|nr:hypothetical protein L1887_43981 [Cichorium endivia]